MIGISFGWQGVSQWQLNNEASEVTGMKVSCGNSAVELEIKEYRDTWRNWKIQELAPKSPKSEQSDQYAMQLAAEKIGDLKIEVCVKQQKVHPSQSDPAFSVHEVKLLPLEKQLEIGKAFYLVVKHSWAGFEAQLALVEDTKFHQAYKQWEHRSDYYIADPQFFDPRKKVESCYYKKKEWLCLDVYLSKSLPDVFNFLSHLKTLTLRCRSVFELPQSFSSLQNLENLTFEGFSFFSLPEAVRKLTNLRELSLSGGPIKELPSWLEDLPNLQKLSFSDCGNLRELPLSIGKWTSLQVFKGSQFKTLPPSFANLVGLKEINLSFVDFNTIPSYFQHFTGLERLTFKYNDAETLPEWLFNLPNLKFINAKDNCFSALEAIRIQGLAGQKRITNPDFECLISIDDMFPVEKESKQASLEESIDFWESEFVKLAKAEGKQEKLPTGTLSSTGGGPTLLTFLEKAKTCEDFKNSATRSLMVIEIHEMLTAMVKDEKFRQIAISIMDVALSSCGDRIAIYLNYIRAQRLISHAEDLDEMGLARLLVGLARLDALDKISAELSKESVDPIETILGYHVLLREALDLPVATQKMLYPYWAKANDEHLQGIQKEVLKQTEDVQKILLSSPSWLDLIRKKHAIDFSKIDEKFLEPEILEGETEGSYLARFSEVKKLKEAAQQEAYSTWTHMWLQQNQQALQSYLKK